MNAKIPVTMDLTRTMLAIPFIGALIAACSWILLSFLTASLYGIAAGTVAIAVLAVANSAFMFPVSGGYRLIGLHWIFLAPMLPR